MFHSPLDSPCADVITWMIITFRMWLNTRIQATATRGLRTMVFNHVRNRMTIQVLFSLSSAPLTETLYDILLVFFFFWHMFLCTKETNSSNAFFKLVKTHPTPLQWNTWKTYCRTCGCVFRGPVNAYMLLHHPKASIFDAAFGPAIGSCDPDRAFLRLRSGAPKIKVYGC